MGSRVDRTIHMLMRSVGWMMLFVFASTTCVFSSDIALNHVASNSYLTSLQGSSKTQKDLSDSVKENVSPFSRIENENDQKMLESVARVVEEYFSAQRDDHDNRVWGMFDTLLYMGRRTGIPRLDSTTMAASFLYMIPDEDRVMVRKKLSRARHVSNKTNKAILDRLDAYQHCRRNIPELITIKDGFSTQNYFNTIIALADSPEVFLMFAAYQLNMMQQLLAVPLHDRTFHELDTIYSLNERFQKTYAIVCERLGLEGLAQEFRNIAFFADYEELKKQDKNIAWIENYYENALASYPALFTNGKLQFPLDEKLVYESVKKDIIEKIRQKLSDEKIEDAKIMVRLKSVYSIYEKIQSGRPLDKIEDLIGVRIITKNSSDAVKAKKVIPKLFGPPGRPSVYDKYEKGIEFFNQKVRSSDGRLYEFQFITQKEYALYRNSPWAHWLLKARREFRDYEIPQKFEMDHVHMTGDFLQDFKKIRTSLDEWTYAFVRMERKFKGVEIEYEYIPLRLPKHAIPADVASTRMFGEGRLDCEYQGMRSCMYEAFSDQKQAGMRVRKETDSISHGEVLEFVEKRSNANRKNAVPQKENSFASKRSNGQKRVARMNVKDGTKPIMQTGQYLSEAVIRQIVSRSKKPRTLLFSTVAIMPGAKPLDVLVLQGRKWIAENGYDTKKYGHNDDLKFFLFMSDYFGLKNTGELFALLGCASFQDWAVELTHTFEVLYAGYEALSKKGGIRFLHDDMLKARLESLLFTYSSFFKHDFTTLAELIYFIGKNQQLANGSNVAADVVRILNGLTPTVRAKTMIVDALDANVVALSVITQDRPHLLLRIYEVLREFPEIRSDIHNDQVFVDDNGEVTISFRVEIKSGTDMNVVVQALENALAAPAVMSDDGFDVLKESSRKLKTVVTTLKEDAHESFMDILSVISGGLGASIMSFRTQVYDTNITHSIKMLVPDVWTDADIEKQFSSISQVVHVEVSSVDNESINVTNEWLMFQAA